MAIAIKYHISYKDGNWLSDSLPADAASVAHLETLLAHTQMQALTEDVHALAALAS